MKEGVYQPAESALMQVRVGEAASTDENALKSFSVTLKETIDMQGITPDQIFNADKTGLYWKRVPSQTFVSQEERRAPGFKAMTDLPFFSEPMQVEILGVSLS